jgi:NitT/TauT family transport system substrate-binding protein
VGITPDQYTEVNVPVDVALFATGDPPVWGAYSTGMLFTVQQAGYKVNVIYPDDYGVHFYGDTIFTTDDMVAKNSGVTLRFLRASLKGWTWAVENSAAIGPMVLKYLPSGDAALETARMAASIPLINTGEDYVGWMRPEVWTGMESTLRVQNVMTKTVDLSQVYTMQFLREVYKSLRAGPGAGQPPGAVHVACRSAACERRLGALGAGAAYRSAGGLRLRGSLRRKE